MIPLGDVIRNWWPNSWLARNIFSRTKGISIGNIALNEGHGISKPGESKFDKTPSKPTPHIGPRVVLLASLLTMPACNGIPDLPCPPFCLPPEGGEYDCENPPETPAAFYAPKDWKSGKVIVKLRKLSDRSGALTLLPSSAVYDRLTRKFGALKDMKRMTNVGMFSVEADLATILKLVLDSSVAEIHPVKTHKITPLEGEPNDGPLSWGQDAIDARDGLDNKYAPKGDGAGVRVCVIDTGITPHIEFEDRLSDDCHTEFSSCQDGHGHGTHVSGTIGGQTWGVSDKVTLHACKALSDKGSGSTDQVIGCVDWCIGLKAKYGDPVVINMSLGGPPDPPLDDALCRAHAAGVPAALAAGNDSGASACNSSPARVKQPLTVMASTRGDSLAGFSNVGVCTDLVAPGQDIRSAKPGGSFQDMSGTSMAAPHVAGVLAICMGLNPELGVGCIERILAESTADRISGVPDDSPNVFLFVGTDALEE